MTNWKWFLMKEIVAWSKHPDICLQRLRKIAKYLSQYNRCPAIDSNLAPPESQYASMLRLPASAIGFPSTQNVYRRWSPQIPLFFWCQNYLQRYIAVGAGSWALTVWEDINAWSYATILCIIPCRDPLLGNVRETSNETTLAAGQKIVN
jgi:hypothetical protein